MWVLQTDEADECETVSPSLLATPLGSGEWLSGLFDENFKKDVGFSADPRHSTSWHLWERVSEQVCALFRPHYWFTIEMTLNNTGPVRLHLILSKSNAEVSETQHRPGKKLAVLENGAKPLY